MMHTMKRGVVYYHSFRTSGLYFIHTERR